MRIFKTTEPPVAPMGRWFVIAGRTISFEFKRFGEIIGRLVALVLLVFLFSVVVNSGVSDTAPTWGQLGKVAVCTIILFGIPMTVLRFFSVKAEKNVPVLTGERRATAAARAAKYAVIGARLGLRCTSMTVRPRPNTDYSVDFASELPMSPFDRLVMAYTTVLLSDRTSSVDAPTVTAADAVLREAVFVSVNDSSSVTDAIDKARAFVTKTLSEDTATVQGLAATLVDAETVTGDSLVPALPSRVIS